MDLFFEPTRGIPFCIEVGYFDTMQEIKEKVAKYHGIPVHEQTLIFNNKNLPDDLNIHSSDILDRSRIQLVIHGTTAAAAASPQDHTTPTNAATIAATKVKIEEAPSTPSPSPNTSSRKIKLFMKTPTLNLGMAMDMDIYDQVLRLKEKIHEMEGIPLNRMVVLFNGIELQDHKTLYECQLFDNSEVEVTLKPLTITTTNTTTPQVTTNVIGNYSKKLKVTVMSKCGMKIMVDVNPLDNVGELRKELQKVRNQGIGFHLPEEGYFFIYKQNVMEEDQSFRWHRVGQGDVIEIFNGCVTGGS